MRKSKPWARRAMARPIRPMPRMPSFLPLTLRASGNASRLAQSSAHETVARAELSRRGDQKAHPEIRHVVDQHVRRGCDPDLPGPGAVEIDRARSNPIDSDDLQSREPIHEIVAGPGGSARRDRPDPWRDISQEGRPVLGLKQTMHVIVLVQAGLEWSHHGLDEQD